MIASTGEDAAVTTEQLLTTSRRVPVESAPDLDERDPDRPRAGTRLRRDPRRWLRAHPSLMVFLACFLALSSVLLVKNRHAFSDPIHEDGDFAANSIIIQDAAHFDLFHGNYSRQGFHHPGPAAFYVQAAGEFVLHDALHVAPTDFDAHLISILLLYAALVGLALMIIYDASRSPTAVVLAFAAIVVFASSHALVLSSSWMPYYYFAPFFLFLVAAGSVGAGNARHLWCLAFAGGLLVHGHAEFLSFVPPAAVIAIAALAFAHRRTGWRSTFADNKRHWYAFAGVLGLFLLPIAIDFVVNYPGEFANYWKYSQSDRAGGHTLRQALDYVLSFWSRDPDGGYAFPAVLVGVAALLAAVHPSPKVRSLLLGALAAVLLATAWFVFYAVRGIDDLGEQYIGFFYWAAPMTVVAVAVVGAAGFVREHTRLATGAMVVAVGVTLVAMRGAGLVDDYRGAPQLPSAVQAMEATRVQPTQPLVFGLDDGAWPDALGAVLEADRQGVRACIADARWELLVTRRFICNSSEVSTGQHLYFSTTPATGTAIVAGLPRSAVVTGDGPAAH